MWVRIINRTIDKASKADRALIMIGEKFGFAKNAKAQAWENFQKGRKAAESMGWRCH